jgi:hypothetical protein
MRDSARGAFSAIEPRNQASKGAGDGRIGISWTAVAPPTDVVDILATVPWRRPQNIRSDYRRKKTCVL